MEKNAPNARSLRNASASAALNFDESKRRMEEAARWIAGGINSNFRAGISPTPLVIERGEGPYLFDADGNLIARVLGELNKSDLQHRLEWMLGKHHGSVEVTPEDPNRTIPSGMADN